MVSTVLIVEDDLTFSTMLKTWLGKKGFDVETASTSARARKILLSKEFDLVISDLRLLIRTGSTCSLGSENRRKTSLSSS